MFILEIILYLCIISIPYAIATNITVSASISPVIRVSLDQPIRFYPGETKQESKIEHDECTERSIFATTIEEAVLNFRLPIPGMQQSNDAAISPDLTLAPDGSYKCTSDDCKNCISTLEKYFKARKYRGESDEQLMRRHELALKRYCNRNFKFADPEAEVPTPPPPATTPAPPVRRSRRPTFLQATRPRFATTLRRTTPIQAQPSIATIPFPISETFIIERFWKRRKRQAEQPDIIRKLTLDCYSKGEEIPGDPGFAGLCNWCWVLYQLTNEYSPRFVNDVECGIGRKVVDSMCLKGVGVCRATDKNVKHNRWIRGRLETYERSVKVNCECRFDQTRSNTCAILP